ncbi:MAG: FAD-binding protein [Opitutales bacterium]|nr:FAD-binding protein [Opitutales bacterium]
MSEIPEKTFDAAIVGLGPAGATLARLLAARGLSVVAVDRKKSDPDSGGFQKPCGGLLAEDAQRSLSRQGLSLPKSVLADPQLFSVRTIDLHTARERTYRRFYINMNRHRFDLWLKSLIPASATVFHDATVRNFSRNENGIFELSVYADHEEKRVFARTLVGADGASSIIRRKLFPEHKIRDYTAVQQWFSDEQTRPLYACFFDDRLTDCYGWAVSKDGELVFGAAFPREDSSKAYELFRERAERFGFSLKKPVRTEACRVLRPEKMSDFVLGDGNGTFLIGEAAGMISPSSLEGMSYAMDSAEILADILSCAGMLTPEKFPELAEHYRKRSRKLRLKLLTKILKNPFMYQPTLRNLVMRSGIAAERVKIDN